MWIQYGQHGAIHFSTISSAGGGGGKQPGSVELKSGTMEVLVVVDQEILRTDSRWIRKYTSVSPPQGNNGGSESPEVLTKVVVEVVVVWQQDNDNFSGPVATELVELEKDYQQQQ